MVKALQLRLEQHEAQWKKDAKEIEAQRKNDAEEIEARWKKDCEEAEARWKADQEDILEPLSDLELRIQENES